MDSVARAERARDTIADKDAGLVLVYISQQLTFSPYQPRTSHRSAHLCPSSLALPPSLTPSTSFSLVARQKMATH